MPKLYVVGDSFTHQFKTQTTSIWIDQLAERLGCDSVVNESFMGVSQDFCWAILQQWEDQITPEDYLIVAVTHPGRYWYIHEHPDLSNANIIGLEKIVSKEQADAIEGYIRHIQRPALDTVQMTSRLGWLAYMVRRNNWRSPLMLKCFEMNLYELERYSELTWAKGVLYDVQRDEFVESSDTSTQTHFSGMDCRFNHLCLKNHKIMAEKCADWFLTSVAVDLTHGFHQHFLTQELIDNDEFFMAEFNLDVREYYLQQRAKYKDRRVESWLDTIKRKK